MHRRAGGGNGRRLLRPQSALDPAGQGAERIHGLTLWMFGGGIVVWRLVMALAVHSIFINAPPMNRRKAALFIIGGGAPC